ncbi:hypothetical protein AC579_3790 [Pseudocercospora musae]|uniref:Uncharacterized protein n=1 Tax=Pseudocercospora musae TaxID=113226 RepID=A0A139I1G4_9PEZI|nr:hypothetical protein AC579_3790 [Pseudocercospora musae]
MSTAEVADEFCGYPNEADRPAIDGGLADSKKVKVVELSELRLSLDPMAAQSTDLCSRTLLLQEGSLCSSRYSGVVDTMLAHADSFGRGTFGLIGQRTLRLLFQNALRPSRWIETLKSQLPRQFIQSRTSTPLATTSQLRRIHRSKRRHKQNIQSLSVFKPLLDLRVVMPKEGSRTQPSSSALRF